MHIYAIEAALIAVSYAIGCLSTGYYLTRWHIGADVRGMGSGSVGARNVGRVLGRKAFSATLVGDAVKGVIPVAASLVLEVEQWAVTAALLAVVVGHIWPAQLGLRGGKGLATATGALLVFDYRLAFIAFAAAGIVWLISRNATGGGLTSVALTPFIALVVGHSLTTFAALAVTAIAITFAHRENLRTMFAQRA